MGWETRKGTSNTYYTQSKRVDGRVWREYFGRGAKGRAAARQSDAMRQLRSLQRWREAEKESQWAAAESSCEELCHFVEMALHAYMAEAGYHYHRGEWRKRRVPKEKPAKEQPAAADDLAREASPQPSESVRSPAKPTPKRRPMPQRRMLECRLGLVRNGVGPRSRRWINRLGNGKGVGCFFRFHADGTTTHSQCEKSTRPRTLPIGRRHRARAPPGEGEGE